MLAGLALLVAGILIPAQRELHDLRNELRKVESGELRTYSRLEAYDRFLSGLQSADPDIVRRLAIAQLNLVPKGEHSFLLTPGMNQSVAQWIDESVPTRTVKPDPYPDTLLGRIALGPNRLWLLASAVFLLFVGLLLGSETGRSATLERDAKLEPELGPELPKPVDQPVATEVTGAATATLERNADEEPQLAAASMIHFDRIKAFVAAATFVDGEDTNLDEPTVADALAAVAARIDARIEPVLVILDAETDEDDDDIIDDELVARAAEVADADSFDDYYDFLVETGAEDEGDERVSETHVIDAGAHIPEATLFDATLFDEGAFDDSLFEVDVGTEVGGDVECAAPPAEGAD